MTRPDAGAAPLLVLQRLAAWSSRLSLEDVPAAAAAKSRQGILDTLGVAIAGRDHDAAQVFGGVIGDLGAGQEATLLSGGTSSAQLAAQLFAYQAHVLDFDDTHFDAIVHVNSPVVATVLAVGEACSATGSEALLAHLAGVEVTSRVGIAQAGQQRYGWHLTGTAGAFGSATAAARLLGLDAERTAHALAIVSTLSSGLRGHRGTMTKALNPANAAGNGVMAAYAARRGLDASLRIFDDPDVGYLVSHGAPHAPDLADGLPDTLRMLDWDPKPYPCGVVIHPAVDAALDARAGLAQAPTAADVDSVVIEVHPLALALTGTTAPSDGLESKFSVFHAVATALLEGSLLPRHFDDAWVQGRDVVSLRTKVSATVRDDLPRDEAAITLRLTDGEVVTHRAKARGTRQRRMSDSDVAAKFMSLTEPIIGGARARGLADAVAGLQDETDIGRLVRDHVCQLDHIGRTG